MTETTEQVIERIIERCDGEKPLTIDALELLDALGLPHTFQATVLNLVEDIVYNRQVVNAFEGDATWAYEQYVAEPGERGYGDTAYLELIEEGFQIEAANGVKMLLDLADVTNEEN